MALNASLKPTGISYGGAREIHYYYDLLTPTKSRV